MSTVDLNDLLGVKRRGPGCTIPGFLDRLHPHDRDVILQALDHPDGNVAEIARTITALLDGPGPLPQTVARHRKGAANGGCRCPRPADG